MQSCLQETTNCSDCAYICQQSLHDIQDRLQKTIPGMPWHGTDPWTRRFMSTVVQSRQRDHGKTFTPNVPDKCSRQMCTQMIATRHSRAHGKCSRQNVYGKMFTAKRSCQNVHSKMFTAKCFTAKCFTGKC